MAGETPAISLQPNALLGEILSVFSALAAPIEVVILFTITENQNSLGKPTSLREETAVIRRSNTSVCIAVIVCALASLVMQVNAQEPLTRPEGLPDWARSEEHT